MSVSYFQHKGKKIMFIDYSKCKTIEDTLDVLDMIKQEYLKTNEMIISLSDFNNAFGSTEFMKKANQ